MDQGRQPRAEVPRHAGGVGEERAPARAGGVVAAAELEGGFLDRGIALGNPPHARNAQKRSRSVGGAAAETALVWDVLLDMDAQRIGFAVALLARKQIDRFEHDVLAHGNGKRGDAASSVARNRDVDVVARSRHRRVRRSVFLKRLKGDLRSKGVGSLQVENVVQGNGMENGRHVVIAVFAPVSHLQKKVHLGGSGKLKPRALDLRGARDGKHIDGLFKLSALPALRFLLVRRRCFT